MVLWITLTNISLLSIMSGAIRQKTNKEREDLNILDQDGLTDLDRTLHPDTAASTSFSRVSHSPEEIT